MEQHHEVHGLHYSYSKINFGVSIVFGSLTSLAVLFRVYARRISGASLGADDYVIFICLVFPVSDIRPGIRVAKDLPQVLCLGLCIMAAWASLAGGLGVPLSAQTPDLAVAFQKVSIINVRHTELGCRLSQVGDMVTRAYLYASYRPCKGIHLSLLQTDFRHANVQMGRKCYDSGGCLLDYCIHPGKEPHLLDLHSGC